MRFTHYCKIRLKYSNTHSMCIPLMLSILSCVALKYFEIVRQITSDVRALSKKFQFNFRQFMWIKCNYWVDSRGVFGLSLWNFCDYWFYILHPSSFELSRMQSFCEKVFTKHAFRKKLKVLLRRVVPKLAINFAYIEGGRWGYINNINKSGASGKLREKIVKFSKDHVQMLLANWAG